MAEGVRAKWGFAAALALVVEYGRRAEEEQGLPTRTRCPRCGCTGDTRRDFGTRRMGGRVRPQSWCRSCRSTRTAPQAPTSPVPPPTLSAAPGETGWLFAG